MDADDGLWENSSATDVGTPNLPAPRDPMLAKALCAAFHIFESLIGRPPNGTDAEAEVLSDFLCQNDEWRRLMARDTKIG